MGYIDFRYRSSNGRRYLVYAREGSFWFLRGKRDRLITRLYILCITTLLHQIKKTKKAKARFLVLEARIRCSRCHCNAFFIFQFLIQGSGERRPYSPAHVCIYKYIYVLTYM